MKYVIRLAGLGLVAGFSKEHQHVQCTPAGDRARKFSNKAAAEKFVAAHVDVGHGMTASQTVVEPVDGRCDFCLSVGVNSCRHEGM